MQRGSSSIFLLIGVLAVVAITGGAYYFGSPNPSNRTGAIDLGLLTPLMDSILKHWHPATFDQNILVTTYDEKATPNYVF